MAIIKVGDKATAPSVRPSLLLDFANSKALDPRISFTRSSIATYYDGKTTALAEENFRKYSQDFTNAYWLPNGASFLGNQTTSPDGTTTADRCSPNTSNQYHDAYTNTHDTKAGEYYTHSVYVKQGTGINGVYFYSTFGSGGSIAKFDIVNGTYIGNASGNGYSAFLSRDIENVGNGWYRISATFLETGSATRPFTVGFHPANNDVVDVWAGNATDHFFLWGSQVERRSSVTTYTATTSQPITKYQPKLLTANANEPRFNHYPITGESRGLLVEEARTNIIPYSTDFDQWSNKQYFDLEFNYAIAPDGTQTATKISESTFNVQQLFFYSLGTVGSVGETQTFSVYAKAYTYDVLLMTIYGETTVSFNLTNGTVSGGGGSIEPVGNGWYRCIFTRTRGQTTTNAYIGFSTSTYSGVGYQKSLLVWGAQYERAAFPTSYIPTSGSTGTRPQEVIESTGTSFTDWYIDDAWSAYIEFDTNTTNTYAGAMSFNDGSSLERVIFAAKQASDGLALNVRGQGNATQAYLTTTTGYANDGTTLQRIAGTVGLNDHAFSGNGTATQTDTSGTVPFGINRFAIGTSVSGSTEPMTGHVRKIAYYPTRLTNDELQALTEE